jgi:integrase/recombinase XerD
MTKQAISPLRQRMIEDMAIRKLAPKTQHDYVQRVKDFATFLGRSPDLAQSEDVRGFRLHLASSGAGAPKINATVSALRFFFNVTLDRPEIAKHLAFVHEPRKAPVVLSPEEVARFLEAAPSVKYKAAHWPVQQIADHRRAISAGLARERLICRVSLSHPV